MWITLKTTIYSNLKLLNFVDAPLYIESDNVHNS